MMKVVLTLACVVAAATAQIIFPAIQKPTGRPSHHEEWRQIMETLRLQMEEDRMTMEEERQKAESNRPHWSASGATQMNFMQKLSDLRKIADERRKQWEEARGWWETMRPTGRPQPMQWNLKRSFLPLGWDVMTKMHKTSGTLCSSHSTKLKHSSKQDGDETEILSPFQSHLDSFKSGLQKLTDQHQDLADDELGDKLKKLFDQHRINIKNARPTGRPTKEDRKSYKKAQNMLKKSKKATENLIEEHINKLKEAAKQKKFEALKVKAAPFLVHADNFKAAMDRLFDENPNAAEDELEKKLDDLYDEFHNQMKLSRPTGRPALGDRRVFRFAHNTLKKAKKDAQGKIEEHGENMRKSAKQKKKEAFLSKLKPFLVHADNFKLVFHDFLSKNPTGSKIELNKMFRDLYKQHKAKMSDLVPTGRPAPVHNKAYEVAKNILKKHKAEAADKLEAWRKQMKNIIGEDAN